MDRQELPPCRQIETILGCEFRDPSLLETALTHRSYVNEHPKDGLESNERLEFLGDVVLGLAVSHMLMETHPAEPEGVLSRWRAALVNERSLARKARRMHLGAHLRLGKGELRSRGREKDSLLADAYEALLGAVYLDRGFEKALEVVRQQFRKDVKEPPWRSLQEDFKSRLQEYTQSFLRVTPRYVLVAEQGPDHEKLFHVRVEVGPELYGLGKGKSKKEAEQQAAKQLLEKLLADPHSQAQK
ncbi:MAG: ribonuclease III [bacterium]